VIDDDHGAALADRFEQRHGLDALARAHAGERLVEQQQARDGRERKSNLQSSLLTIGKLRHRRPGPIGEVNERKRLFDALVQPCDTAKTAQEVEPEGPALLRQRGDDHVLAHGQPRE
jgi:hypothetical protein